jgi:hypothetical protein
MHNMSFSLRAPTAQRLAAAAALTACLLGLASVRSPPAAAGRQPLDLRVSVGLVPGSGATLLYRGTVTGQPLGRGRVSLRSRLGGGGDATVTYVMATSRGTVRGSANVTLSYGATTVTYHGTASITQGSGAYRQVRARGLRISGRTGLSAEHATLRLTGHITS